MQDRHRAHELLPLHGLREGEVPSSYEGDGVMCHVTFIL